MRIETFIIVGVCLSLSSCKNNNELEQQKKINDSLTNVVYELKNRQNYILYDTVFTTKIDTVFLEPTPIINEAPCLVEKYKIERVKYYLAIVDRNPSQLKFLRSWIRRAVQ